MPMGSIVALLPPPVVGPDIQCSTNEIPEGETLEGRCQVTGNPSPTISWLKAGQPIDPTLPLRRENAGLYTIKAEGFVSVHKLLRVFVLCEYHSQTLHAQ